MRNPFEQHDHQICVTDGVAAAEERCSALGLRLTPVRRRVLEILLERHSAMGAYDLLENLQNEGHRAQPPVVYRALEFLVTHGFAHKIEQLNSFVACNYSGKEHEPVFLICKNCENVAEANAPLQEGQLGRAAKSQGFVIDRAVIEATGLCPACAKG